MIPANGVNAPIPHGFEVAPLAVREAHGLVWLWHGELAASNGDTPWLPGAPEASGRSIEIEREIPINYLRAMENLGDIHHTPFVHRLTLPGTGTRIEIDRCEMKDGIIESAMRLVPDIGSRFRFQAAFTSRLCLPTLASINISKRIRFIASATPIDEHNTWIWLRYSEDYLPGWLGGKLLARLAALFDINLVFTRQDLAMISTQQLDDPADISGYQLIDADRAIGMFFGLHKRAAMIAEAKSREGDRHAAGMH